MPRSMMRNWSGNAYENSDRYIQFKIRRCNCSQIGNLIASMTKNPVLFDFSEFDVHPCGRCASECFAARENCPYFEDKEHEILEAIMHSEMVYFVLPNYCDYPCANYFIFNERSQCFFQRKPDLLEAYLTIPKRSIVIMSE